MTKITLATLKSFIRKNKNNLYVQVVSDFKSMVDMVTPVKDDFRLATQNEKQNEHTLGISGLWLVGQSRDYITAYEDENFKGYEIYNSCGSSILAVKK
jgi:hypothetical protein